MLFEQYIYYDVKRLIREYPKLKDTLKQMKSRLATMDGSRGIDYETDRVTTSPTNNQLVNLVARRIALENKIADYEQSLTDYENAWRLLSDQDREILALFYQSGKSYSKAAFTYGAKYDVSDRACTQRLNNAVKNFRFLLFGE